MVALPKNISTLSKVYKSAGWKARKRQQHEANKSLRAQLESQKSAAFGAVAKFAIQQRIDAIGASQRV